jgi:molybdenum ABC transporter molybdate-binding protein
MNMNNVKKICFCAIISMALISGCGKSENNTSADKAKTEPVSNSTTKTEEVEATNTITRFEDVNSDAVSLIALGNSDVPVGQYSEEIFRNLGFWDNMQSKISYGTNVKEVLSQVEEATVDCGVVYATDAATAKGVNVVCTAPEETLETPVIYPAAILEQSANQDAAKVFLNFLLTDDAVEEFETVGFKMAADHEPEDITVDGAYTLTVFAAASLTESLTEIQKLFNVQYPDITLVFNFDSSGTLQTQIEQGASADIFFSAAQKQMNILKENGYINEDTITDLLNNEVVLIIPKE